MLYGLILNVTLYGGPQGAARHLQVEKILFFETKYKVPMFSRLNDEH
jgi:hypothetical protein